MALRIVDWASTTHTGRVRRNNEDSYLANPPLFVVADGMGGAQAGEVASRLTVDAFTSAAADPSQSAMARLRETIQEANRSVIARAQSDPSAAGMGSTVTAALVHDDHVALGHVGDSRAYLLRQGALQQLSNDHSLVAELLRQGRLTPEEAEAHPQRSIITRALGAAADVEVDTEDYEGEPGDIYLLCSDGLSGLVSDDDLLRLLSADGSLEAALRALVRAANDAGGDDNITAVAFKLGTEAEAEAAMTKQAEHLRDRGDEDTLTEADQVPVIRSTPKRVLPPPAPPRKRRHGRLVVALVVVLLLAVAALAGAFEGLRWAHFVGVDPASGHVAVFAGVPVDLGGGHTLYKLTYLSNVDAAALPAATRRSLFDHTLRSSADAVRIVKAVQRDEP